jgi:hypothetical protein
MNSCHTRQQRARAESPVAGAAGERNREVALLAVASIAPERKASSRGSRTQRSLMSPLSTGFRSTIGVPSTASRLRTRTRPPSIDRISTRCSPIGFGRMHPQDFAARTIEPREDDDLVADSDTVETFEHRGLEHEPRLGRPLVALLGG